MVPRLALRILPVAILTGSFLLLLLGCSSMDAPVSTVREFCEIAQGRLPISLSRKDTELTKEQVAKLNSIHKQYCLKPTS